MKSPPLASLPLASAPHTPPPSLQHDEPFASQPLRSHVEWRLSRSRAAADDAPARPAAAEHRLELRVAATDDVTEASSAERAYQLWKGRVWRFAGRLGVPNEQLEDATQDVFTAVFRRWDDFRGQSTRRTWVLGFVPRIASSYRRRRQKPTEATRQETDDGALSTLPSGEVDPFESTARREAKRIVESFLDDLPDLDRQLFVLVDLEDASVVEAAAILELGTRRAYKILDRARRALEATLVRQRAADTRRLP
jgi:RNA polymerase sigma-70 factor (ECF subfamily)